MPPIDRRRFLQQTAAGVTAAKAGWASAAPGGLPPHAETSVPGVHAYAQRSLDAGANVDFRVSSDTPYELTVSRAGTEEAIASLREPRPSMQPIHVGSYAHVERGLAGRTVDALTIEVWIRSWLAERRQGVVTACDGDRGIGLFVSAGGWIEPLVL